MYTGIDDKILDDIQECLLGHKLVTLGLFKEDWEELCIDFLVEEINSLDVLFLVKENELTGMTWNKIKGKVLNKAHRILDDAYSSDLKRWGYEELLEED